MALTEVSVVTENDASVKIYKQPWLTFNTIIVIPGLAILPSLLLYGVFFIEGPALYKALGFLVILPAYFFLFIIIWALRSKIIVSEDGITYDALGKVIQASWSDVIRVQRIFTIYAGYVYHVKTKKGVIGIPDTIKGHEQILKTIKEKTGKSPASEWKTARQDIREEWHGFFTWIKSHPFQFILGFGIIGSFCFFLIWLTARLLK